MSFVVWGTERSAPCVCLIYDLSQSGPPMNEYLHHFIATRDTRASAALGKLALMMLRCKTDKFSHDSGAFMVNRGISFPCSTCQVILVLRINCNAMRDLLGQGWKSGKS